MTFFFNDTCEQLAWKILQDMFLNATNLKSYTLLMTPITDSMVL